MAASRLTALAVALVVPLAVRAAGPAPQTPPPVFGTMVDVVRLDVIVLGRDGKPVTGLTAADFDVEEGGRPQAVTSFEPIVVRGSAPPATTPEAPRTSVNRPRDPQEGRCFFLFFNDVYVTAPVAETVRTALLRFVGTDVRDGDWVTVMAPEQNLWWTARNAWEYQKLRTVIAGLKGEYVRDPLQQGMSDWEALCLEENKDNPACRLGGTGDAAAARVRRNSFQPGVSGGGGTGGGGAASGGSPGDPPLASQGVGGGMGQDNTELLAKEIATFARARVAVTLGGLRQALDSLVPLRGHKSVVLISEGFVLLPQMSGYKELIDAARRANVAIHFVDPRGLQSGYSAEFEDAPGLNPGTMRELNAAGSGDLADATGGHSFASNDPAVFMRRVAAESEAYYLVGYSPDRPVTGERKVRVKVRRDGLTVRARSRYFVAPPETERNAGSSEAPALAAIHAVSDTTDLSLRAATLTFEANERGEVTTLLAAEVSMPPGGPGRHAFKVATEARRAEGGPAVQDRFETTVDNRLGAPALLARQWGLPAGVWQVRVLVEDRASGRLGTVLHTFEVPVPKRLRLSTPILAGELEESGGTRKPRLALSRTFPSGRILYCQYSVYGAASPTAPRVTASWALYRGDDLVREAPPTPIRPTADGRLTRTLGLSLEGAAPGAYSLVLTIEDDATHEQVTRTEEFTVAG